MKNMSNLNGIKHLSVMFNTNLQSMRIIHQFKSSSLLQTNSVLT
ncbi:hypothetical protein HDE69_004752 [Pedobacter cryoconitis]|uniref:Uncharacterized protein n=1 Tax=Pedobacter cryoconitis TaxID=188932 RepID=A0A7W9DMY2_9SPHI|nr:hypothetical protein [Pedobacter cryoconitis]MBB5623665.1 hypothetical protein [Pedobacter cryoconitis]